MTAMNRGWWWVGSFVVGIGGVLGACSSDHDDAPTPPVASEDAGRADSGREVIDSSTPDACTPAIPKVPASRASFACDPVTQDCKDSCNSKCTFWSIDPSSSITGQQFAACGPELGRVAIDAECTRPNGLLGEDNCAKGSFCAAIGKPKGSTGARVCRPLCKATSDCKSNEFCLALTNPSEAVAEGGVCVAQCDPFAPDCRSDETCNPIHDTTNRSRLACSARTPMNPLNGPCTLGNVDTCPVGSVCVTVGSDTRCRAFCDDTHPCDADAGAETCAPQAPNIDFRVCVASNP